MIDGRVSMRERHGIKASQKGASHGHTNCHCPMRSHACVYRNHRAFPGEERVTDGVGKEEAGPHAKVDPA